MANRLTGSTWPELGTGHLLVVPVGSCEQHGPHLPFDTDTRIAQSLADALAGRFDRVVLTPALGITASGEHQSFPGTLSIGTSVFEQVVVELCRSALPPAGSDLPRPFDGVLFVNGHGGNIEPFANAVELLRFEDRDVRVWHPMVPGGDSHAGRTETSILLHTDPGCVRTDRIEAGSTRRWREIGATVMEQGLAAVTPNGVLGDPRGASAEEGAVIFDRLVDDLCTAASEWFPRLIRSDPPGDTGLSGPGSTDRLDPAAP